MKAIEARRLVVEEGLTYAEAADRVGLSVRWVETLASRESWQTARQKHLNITHTYQQQIRQLKAAALERAVKLLTEEPDTPEADRAVRQWSGLEARYPEHRYGDDGDEQAEARRRGRLEGLELMVGFLAEHDPAALGALEPHLDALAVLIERGGASAAA
jgi:predicted DNA-binding protein (UPF0251 family)